MSNGKKKNNWLMLTLCITGGIILAVVILCGGGCVGCYGCAACVGSVPTEDETKNISVNNNNAIVETTEKPTEEIIEITSTELIDAFNENQVKCSKLYDKKKIKVTGTVQSVGTDILNNIYVCLGHDTEFTFVGIQCYAKNKDVENQIAELKEGDIITVIGIGSCGSLSFSLEKAEIITE